MTLPIDFTSLASSADLCRAAAGIPAMITTGRTRVAVQDHTDGATFIAPLVEVLPELDERLDAIVALMRTGTYLCGGGAAPAFTLTLAPAP